MNGQTKLKLDQALDGIPQIEEPSDTISNILNYLNNSDKARRPIEIANDLKMNKNTTRRLVKEMHNKKYLIKSDKIKCGYQVTPESMALYVSDMWRNHYNNS